MNGSRRKFLQTGLTAAVTGSGLGKSLSGKAVPASNPMVSGVPAAGGVAGPQIIKVNGKLQGVIPLQDGRLMGWWVDPKGTGPDKLYLTEFAQKATARFSSDNGFTWSGPQTLFEFPKGFGTYSAGVGLQDRGGKIHLFGLHYFGCGPGGFDNWESCKCLLYHSMSADGGKSWTPAQYCDFGHSYTGATNSVVQLKSGRILAPISYLSGRMTGRFVTNLSLSDNGGKTWRPSKGECVVDTGGHLVESGAIEPVCIELRDGRVWMLMRTQGGYQYESFSSDGGDTWTDPVPSRFVSSNSPGAFLRLRDGRIVFAWNNCLGPENRDGILNSYDRQTLVAAISADEGKTWQGYREIGRIPEGKWEVSYQFLAQATDGAILCSGLDTPYYFPPILVRMRPEWLTETSLKDEFEEGLDKWVTFGCEGVTVVPHPERSGAHVLALRKPKSDVPAAASLNFPFGVRGKLKLRLRLEPSHEFVRQHYYFGLADFFCLPRLPYHGAETWGGWKTFPPGNGFAFRVAPDGRLDTASGMALFRTDYRPTQIQFQAGRWYAIELAWDSGKKECSLSVDGNSVTKFPQLSPAYGMCYLRLWAAVSITDYSGMLVESVDVRVEP